MFDEIMPGYYKKYYGNLSSRFAHSKLTTSIFRTDRASPKKARIIMGCEFNKGFSHSVIKTAIAYGYAYLNYTELFFPTFYSKIDTKMKNEIADILKSINSYFVIEKDHSEKGEYWDLMYSLIQK